MRRSDHRFQMRDTVLLSGWLFADLMLGLFVVFLAANTVGVQPKPIPTPVVIPTATPTPSPTVVTPTPLSRLELSFHRITLDIDSAGLLNNSSSAIDDLQNKIRAQGVLRGRRAGLVIVYGGALTDGQISNAQNVAQKVMGVLGNMGSHGFVFIGTSFYAPLYFLGNSPNTTIIDVYLFTQ